MSEIPVRLGLQQRVLPIYRVPFFETLAAACLNGLSLCAGQPRPSESIEPAAQLTQARLFRARNLHLLGGSAYLCWQAGLISWLRIWQPQALIMEANPRYINTRLAVRWMHARQRPVIGWGLGVPAARSGFLAGSRSRFLMSFDALIAYSAQGAREYASTGFDAQRIFVAPNAVAPRPAAPPPARPAVKPSQADVHPVGRLQARKRIDLLIHASAPACLRKPTRAADRRGPERRLARKTG